jgi:hypothetical protein
MQLVLVQPGGRHAGSNIWTTYVVDDEGADGEGEGGGD